MVASNRLTSLERVRDWVGASTNSDDILLTRLVNEQSRFILSYLQRPSLFQTVVTDVFDGVGQLSQTLRNWPVISVSSVLVGTESISAATGLTGCGYVLDTWDGFPPGRPQAVSLRGHHFWRGSNNVSISYTAGFVIQGEAQTVPSSGIYSLAVNASNGSWAVDQGVTYGNGTALLPVAYSASTSLSQGQYMAQGGNYYFAAADAAKSLLISYSYVPADIEHACMEMVGERYRYKDRIGNISKTLGGQETISFSQKDMPDYIRTLLQPYKRVVLV